MVGVKRKCIPLTEKKRVLAWLEEDSRRTAYQANQEWCKLGIKISASTIRGWIKRADAIKGERSTTRWFNSLLAMWRSWNFQKL
jgi:hypothetical protein